MKKNFFHITIVTLLTFVCGWAEDGVSVQKESGGWQPHPYPKMGLKIQVPDWKADIKDQNQIWSLFAYPLVENPVSDVQYRVAISAQKLTEEQYLRYYREPGSNSLDWINSEHLQTSQMTNDWWILSRRDVFGSNGFAYRFKGHIKRIPKPKDTERVGGEDEKLAAQVRRILESIEVLSTNSVKIR